MQSRYEKTLVRMITNQGKYFTECPVEDLYDKKETELEEILARTLRNKRLERERKYEYTRND